MAGVIRIAIVDDHPASALGLAALLSKDAEFQVVGTAEAYGAAIELLERNPPDVALIDIQLHGQPRGFDILRAFGGDGTPAIVMFSSFDHAGFHREAIELGARGYLAKTASLEEISSAIKNVAAGGTAFAAAALRDARTAPRAPSGRELDVIRLIVDGFSNDEIGARLGLTERTIESHLRRMFTRYSVLSRTELALRAVAEDWVALDSRS